MAAEPGKTEKATPKRRKKVRSEGNVPKSQESTKMVTLLAAFSCMHLYFPYVIERIHNIWRYFFKQIETFELSALNAYGLLTMMAKELAVIVGPIVIVIALAAFLTLRQQVGSLWTFKVFKFKWERFNLFAGVKRLLFSKQSYIRLFKTVALALCVGYMPFLVIMGERDHFSELYYTNAAGLGVYILSTGYKMVLYTMIPLFAIAAYDIWQVFHEWEENNKMSKQEIKDERKQAEGDPIIKSKQRQKMMQILQSRMMQQVPKADVVLTNPTHYAVALKYDQTICPAPLVVAKGVDRVAEKIKEIARESRVPIRENRLLARSLYAQVEVGDPIPEDLYKAVASIIAEIWRAQGKI